MATGIVNLEGLFEPYVGTLAFSKAQESSTSPTGTAPPPTGFAPTVIDSSGGGTTTIGAAQTSALVPDSTAWNGPRTDLSTGWGVRVRVGKLSDGSFGIERYTSTGVRQVPTWS